MSIYIVTGAAGFIGWRVCELLLADGHVVVGVDNLNEAYDVRLKQWRLAQLKRKSDFEFHQLDITDREVVRYFFQEREDNIKFCSSPDPQLSGVINLAARAGVRQSVKNPWVYLETNAIGALNLLESCREHGIKKFVQASTSSLYGKDNPMPYRENQDTSHPLSPYAASKKAAEAVCYSYHHLHHLDITVFRYFTVYGPAGRPDMSLFRFVQWVSEGRPVTVFGDGQQSRDFTYVDDIARGTIAGLKPVGYKVINLGSNTPVVLMEALRLVEEFVGKNAKIEYRPRHPADIVATWADISRAKRILNWQPKYDIREGIHSLVNWYKQNSDWASKLITD